MLNAFRHQRFDTSTPIVRITFRASAQRLSASEIRHSSQLASLLSHNPCAQRLSASEIRHFKLHTQLLGMLNVLNAFRHQRFDTVCKLLNLYKQLRAQRLSASEIRHLNEIGETLHRISAQRLSASEIRHSRMLGSALWFVVTCSTPFGIRDSTRFLRYFL